MMSLLDLWDTGIDPCANQSNVSEALSEDASLEVRFAVQFG